MSTRVALISIIVSNDNHISEVNALLHEAAPYIIGRMGIPYRAKDINIISVAIDAPQDVISALSGKIGKLDGINAKIVYSNVISSETEEK
ncbi:MAG: iron-only hydrogenase system regulator [Eubacterium sp.]|nr:iron-only hydrogenase system regulator [Eubacterium sp.]